MSMLPNLILLLSFLFSSEPVFGDRQTLGVIESDLINESSGIVASRKNDNVFWTHNDSGDLNRIYALNNFGEHLGIYYLDDYDARDWEDIAIGPGPSENENYLYIGDIGDNDSEYDMKYIYRFIEPDVTSNQAPSSQVIYNIDSIEFQYDDGNRDAETLILDPITKDIIIFSKREEAVHVYQLPFPQNIESSMVAEQISSIDFYLDDPLFDLGRIVAGDMSADGTELLIKSFINIFHFPKYENQNFSEILSNPITIVEYIVEPQGEAIGWHPEGYGYFTISEESEDIPCHLYFYPRVVGCTDSFANNYNPYALEEDDSCIYDYIIGDLNQDEIIDVLDIILILNIILDNASPYNQQADCNNDGYIDVLDVVQLLNIILT